MYFIDQAQNILFLENLITFLIAYHVIFITIKHFLGKFKR